jgi:hypothetical protein
MSFKFEKIVVWQKAVDLATDVHELTNALPKDEISATLNALRKTLI